jgi:ribosomal protein S18 acetylase RimI-like enzyme
MPASAKLGWGFAPDAMPSTLDFAGPTLTNCARDIHVDKDTLESPLGDLSVVPATLDQAASVLRLRDDLARWMLEHDIEQWRPGELPLGWIQECISHGWVYVMCRGDKLVSSVTIVWDDPLMWGERPEPAGYIHMLLVDRHFAGHHIGRWLLDWAERFILSSGRDLARLDCVRGNEALRGYYEDAGYRLVGYRDFPDIEWAFEAALYEKPLKG